MSLQHFQAFDQQLSDLLASPPRPETSQPWLKARQRYFADLAEYWLDTGVTGESRKARLVTLLRAQLLAQITLRVDDHTLGSNHAELLKTSIEMPLPGQRQHLPTAERPQIYRPLLDIGTPHWREYLPGAFVIVEGGPEGSMPDPAESSDYVLLCSLSHGIEAFDDLAELHTELCERLDDLQQSRPLLQLMAGDEQRERARNAERLRYEWFNDDPLQLQVQALIDSQHASLTQVWENAAQTSPIDWPALTSQLDTAADLLPLADSRSALQTRYALLLERNSPAWLKNASAQGLTHIMQTMQELVIAIDKAAAPGILSHDQFLDREGLRSWTCEQLRKAMRQQYQFDADPLELHVTVTMARQRGPVLHPGLATGYIPAASRPQVGDTVELVSQSYSLDQLAMLNVSWLDVDYWLTARVHRADGSPVTQITPAQIKQMVRALDVGESYSRYLRTHLLESPTAKWRRDSYADISRARMRAEAAKARYAGHYLEDAFERGYLWTSTVLDHPDSEQRKALKVMRLSVRQLSIDGHTVQGVMLITPENAGMVRFLVYTPDAPDRRAWREFRNPRHMLRTLREKPALRDYVKERMPLANPDNVERWLSKGGLSPRISRPEITGDFQHALYRAEVHAALAAVDAATNTKLELLGDFSLHVLWVILDLLSLVLPLRALAVLSFARAAISIIDTHKAYVEGDRIGMLRSLVDAFSYASDGINSVSGSTVLRRAIRAMPPTPPLSLPPAMVSAVNTSKLRYRVDGIHKEGIYEQHSPYPGLTFYFIKDSAGQTYQVAFDGYRWRVIDPRKPDAYTKVPVKRREDGEWVVDSPVLWYDGLPDLKALFDTCRLAEVPAGEKHEDADGLYQSDQGLYLLAGGHALPLRAHLLKNHYRLLLAGQNRESPASAILRWQDRQWSLRVRQAGRSSDWLTLPQAYSVSRGSN
ncbi:DUF6543 domain-containing protein [Pseudomonas sp. MH2]|uniref:DUF6543 domain-containing protein n=1 Tax=Pseudomonas machongensis TaxID=3110229 RepID=A0ABU5VGG3_9PSED|nr:DUF6543 domain-containing protein [Pseudomonas sp. MH2]MEA5672461.1 DUF6543 domain-containing protein [Pseudomonas sp. MH2]